MQNRGFGTNRDTNRGYVQQANWQVIDKHSEELVRRTSNFRAIATKNIFWGTWGIRSSEHKLCSTPQCHKRGFPTHLEGTFGTEESNSHRQPSRFPNKPSPIFLYPPLTHACAENGPLYDRHCRVFSPPPLSDSQTSLARRGFAFGLACRRRGWSWGRQRSWPFFRHSARRNKRGGAG